MKKSFKYFIEELWKRKGGAKASGLDFDRVSEWLKKHDINLESRSLKKLWKYVSTTERPKRKTLDRLSLFAGFQDWDELQRVFRG